MESVVEYYYPAFYNGIKTMMIHFRKWGVFMSEIKITVFYTGMVCVSPNLPFGEEECNIIKELY